ncbi:uncharacterized protein LOC134039751 [Osmerus eperlanus]|uniref:uncharacterized protein LOC134039751 n=1 Tax=Osmerus eperlanus TaxID=29151 RepID=UPI002E118984
MNDTTYMCILCCLLHICRADNAPPGMFRTECQDRNFWVAVSSNFLGTKFRFAVEGSDGRHILRRQQAAECGFTMVLDTKGDLVLRASFLACYVVNEKDSDFSLLVWFLHQDEHGEERSYPLQLSCLLEHPWKSREIICEENYMEVSVRKLRPPAAYQGVEWMALPPEMLDEGMSEWRVVFRVPGSSHGPESPPAKKETVPVETAQLLGYHVTASDARITLRCAYDSRLSYKLQQENGVEVEVLSASILYKHQWALLQVDASVACTTKKVTMDGGNLLWTVPIRLSPLVRAPFRDRGLRVGVEGRLVSNCTARQRGYIIRKQGGNIEIRIPFGAEGGYIKSHVQDGHYFQSYFLDLFYMQQWEDAHWPMTVSRSYRSLSIKQLPQTPQLINVTKAAERVFSVAVGSFPPDVFFSYLSVGEQTVSWDEVPHLGFKLSEVPFPNGTHGYLLQIPFSHPLVSQKYIGNGYRNYRLTGAFTFILSPHGELFHHPITVETDLQDVVLPRVEGDCTDKGVRLLVHLGNMISQWELYIGGRRLDQELVELAGYELISLKNYSTLQIPLYGLGMAYEGLGIQGLVVNVEVSVEDKETSREESTFTQQCVFPVRELLVCLPDDRVVVMVDLSSASLDIEPSLTTLLDPSCTPVQVDGTRAIFSFSLDSCGTIRNVEEDQVVYTNEVRYSATNVPYPLFRVPLGCVYPLNGSRSMSLYHPRHVSPWAPSRASRSRLFPPRNRGRASSPSEFSITSPSEVRPGDPGGNKKANISN